MFLVRNDHHGLFIFKPAIAHRGYETNLGFQKTRPGSARCDRTTLVSVNGFRKNSFSFWTRRLLFGHRSSCGAKQTMAKTQVRCRQAKKNKQDRARSLRIKQDQTTCNKFPNKIKQNLSKFKESQHGPQWGVRYLAALWSCWG